MSRIASVDLKKQTVTVTSRDRKQKTYKIGNDARLIRDQRPAKLKDFRSGDMVMLRLEKDSIVGMFARTGRGGPGGGRFGGPPGGQGGPRGPRGGAGGQGGPGGGNVDDMVKRIFGLDANKDGKLTKQEIGTRGARMFERGDTNKDGFLTKEELTKAMKSIRGRGASGGRPPRE